MAEQEAGVIGEAMLLAQEFIIRGDVEMLARALIAAEKRGADRQKEADASFLDAEAKRLSREWGTAEMLSGLASAIRSQ